MSTPINQPLAMAYGVMTVRPRLESIQVWRDPADGSCTVGIQEPNGTKAHITLSAEHARHVAALLAPPAQPNPA